MPAHDWTRVPADIFHDFQLSWATHITELLNLELLPKNFYALTASQAFASIASNNGNLAVLMKPNTRLSLKTQPMTQYRHARRTIVIRNTSGH